MKTLKITVFAIFTIVFLTGVSQLKGDTTPNESFNHEINPAKVKLSVFNHLKLTIRPKSVKKIIINL